MQRFARFIMGAASGFALLACEGAKPEPRVAAAQSALESNGECLIGDETLEHACLHANYGPFAAVQAQPYPGAVFSNVNTPHTAYTVTLPAVTGGYRGAVLFEPTVSGEFGFLLDSVLPVTVYDSLGNPVAAVGTAPGDAGLCAQVAQVAVFSLVDTEAYTVVLGTSTDVDPVLIVEYLGVEASCTVSCEPITLEASRTYHPAAWNDGEVTLDHDIVFELPKKIVVTQGNAGLHLATLTVSAEGEEVECSYRGNGHRRYVFARCSNGARPGDDMTADYLRLHVQRGANDGPNQTTAVSLTIQPECEGDHHHEEESP